MMSIAEFFFIFSFKAFNGGKMEMVIYQENIQFVLFSLISKVLYLLLAFMFSMPKNRERNLKNRRDSSSLLFILPLLTVITFSVLYDVSVAIETERSINILFGLLAMIFLAANVAMFFIHNRIMRESEKNTELRLRDEINREYYADLEKQFESSAILIHDMKRHLNAMRELAKNEDGNESVVGYIDSVFEGNEALTVKRYSQNKLVNVIITRYSVLCRENGIAFFPDVRDVDFSFISDSDLVSLLDNLLENAVEAAKNAEEKVISLTADIRNEAYLLISIENTVGALPVRNEKGFETQKADKLHHGVGLKSVTRIVKRYGGETSFEIANGRFCASVLLKIAEPEILIRGEKSTVKILIDADGCPVVRSAVKIAAEYGAEAVIFCDTSHEFHEPNVKTVTVDKGADSADFAIVNSMDENDAVITQDYGLAAMALSKRAFPLRKTGLRSQRTTLTRFCRQGTFQKLRMSGKRLRGPRKRTPNRTKRLKKLFGRCLKDLPEANKRLFCLFWQTFYILSIFIDTFHFFNL